MNEEQFKAQVDALCYRRDMPYMQAATIDLIPEPFPFQPLDDMAGYDMLVHIGRGYVAPDPELTFVSGWANDCWAGI